MITLTGLSLKVTAGGSSTSTSVIGVSNISNEVPREAVSDESELVEMAPTSLDILAAVIAPNGLPDGHLMRGNAGLGASVPVNAIWL
jgi:hypothetical protein